MERRAFLQGSAKWVAALAVALAAVGLLAWGLFGHAGSVSADPELGQSVDVCIITTPDVDNGGYLPTSGAPGELGDFTFSNLAAADVTAANLANCDTVALNMVSEDIYCDTDLLSAGAKDALIDFVSGGGKLIIYDSECPPVDYSWLPYPFTTTNPGQLGESLGTLTIVEENTLSSSDSEDPYFIDAPNLASETDAVGDMNVMVTRDRHWCLDMAGTNAEGQSGAVHTYASYGSGLMIYNGLDVDYMGDEPTPPYPNGLRKIWLQELQQSFNPDNLPCTETVVTATPQTHKRSTDTPTPEPTETAAPPTSTTQPPPPPPPVATATPSGGTGPLIVAPSTGEGTGAGLPWTPIACLLATLGATAVVVGYLRLVRGSRRG